MAQNESHNPFGITTLFYRQPRITILVICLILVSGLSSFFVLPRMEDPLMTERVALIKRVRRLAVRCAKAYVESREKLGFPLLSGSGAAAPPESANPAGGES